MALIPPDAGIRMRMQAESSLLQPVRPAHEIPSDLPDLRPGQTFTARIQEVLPNNSYAALVAGKQLTLQLPEGAKAGDQLELVVVDRSAKAVIAKQVGVEANAQGESVPYEFTKLSPAARIISQLLPAEGESAKPAQLNRGQPLLAQPPDTRSAAAQLAPALARGVSQSGLFYESHQAQWVTGQRPLEQILQEPQGQQSTPTALLQGNLGTGKAGTPNTLLQALQGGSEKVGAGRTAGADTPASTATPAQAIPDDLHPLVQQQLEAVATNRMFWHGEVWPQQAMDWTIELENEREGSDAAEEGAHWNTALSLTTPRLGRVDASLQLTRDGVRITLSPSNDASAADLEDEAPQLALALEAAGVPLLSFHVRHETGR